MFQGTLEYQIFRQECEHCHQTFNACRGSIREEGKGIGIFLAAMHSCKSPKTVHLAIGFCPEYLEESAISITMQVSATDDEFQMSVVDYASSPWINKTHLGKMLGRQEALSYPRISEFYSLADQILLMVPEIEAYFSSKRLKPRIDFFLVKNSARR